MRKVITLFILLFMLGCSINVRSTIDVPVNVAAETNLDVDVIVGEQIVGEAKGTLLFDRLCIKCPSEYTEGVFGGKYSILKAAATHDAMDGTGADLIINSQYVLKRDWNALFTTVHVTVTGHTGKIKNID